MAPAPRIAIIGGGIGGLTTARALLGRGFEVAVFESAPQLREIGAGVALAPNAMKALRSLDLEHSIRDIGWESDYQMIRSWKGKIITKISHADTADRYGAAGCSAHRADVLDVLAASVPESNVTLGARCDSVTTDDATATAQFVGGSEIEADVIVGADGIHSVVRASLFGPDAPRFTGKICYRSVIPVDQTPARSIEPYRGLWLGPHGTIVVYGMRGGELINVVCHYDDENYKHESWIAECDRAEVLDRYRDWDRALADLFASSDVWYKWALYDRDPIPQWTKGRATVLGDAAHSMLPYLGQGACQAIEDGCVLAMALDANRDDLTAGLQLFERARRPRASKIVLTARAQGEENHLVSPIEAFKRNVRLKLHRRFKPGQGRLGSGWIYEYDAGSPAALSL